MKIFTVILTGGIFVLSILSTPSWSSDSWPELDTSKEIAADGFEFFDNAKNYRLAIEKEKSKGDFEFNILLAQATTEAAGSTAGQPSTKAGMSEAEERAMIAEALANPLSYLWLMFTQNDTKWYDGDILDRLGEDAKVQNTLLMQPVMSIQLTEKWKTILRPVIPINSFSTVDNIDISTGNKPPPITGVDFDRETGLGDIILWTAFSNQYKPPFIWGFGPTIMMPTATDDMLGTGKWSAGPMALAFSITEKWIVGGVFQHWWSFAGDDYITINTSLGPASVERSDVNLTDFQYVIRYRLTPETNIGMGPNIQYNWETSELSLPVGMGFDTMAKIGKLPVKIGAEAYYYVAKDDDFGPEWQLRLFFVPVLPAPGWSQKPLF
ncbi:MAG: hypothetical protein AB1Z20_22730 [Desulfobacterales bacterium]